MFLKRLELLGFKSFADKTTIEFKDGITALLGPNGCGKSNVVDAVKWVLGEQSTKALRGGKMEDVIFNGTEQRKALNVAEVTMTIANDDGILDLDLAEVSIKRRLYRTGESEYYINNMPARLKEIREIFFDTGIGKSAYSVMEQGRISQVLSNKPEERRHIFEEAAGITKYKARGAEAERKLEKTRENMGQVENILAEVKRSYDTLNRQSQKTLEYRELKDQIFQQELRINKKRYKTLDERLVKREESRQQAEQEYGKLKEEIGSLSGELHDHMNQVSSMETRLIQGQKELYGIDLEKENYENRRRMAEEKRQEIASRGEGLARDMAQLEEKGQTLQENREKKEAEQEAGRGELEDISRLIQSFQEKITKAGESIDANSQEIEDNEAQGSEKEALIEEAQNELRGITDDIVSQLDAGLKESGYSWQERKNSEESLLSRLEGLSIMLKGKLDLFSDAGSLADLPADEMTKILQSGMSALQEGLDEVDGLRESLRAYLSTNPAFLDEFLAPEGIITQKRTIDQRIEDLRHAKNQLKERNQILSDENKELNRQIEEYRKNLEELRVSHVRKETQLAALKETLELLSRDIDENTRKKKETQRQREENKENLEKQIQSLQQIEKEKEGILEKEESLKKEMAELEKTISHQNKEVAGQEKNLKSLKEKDQQQQLKQERLLMEIKQITQEIAALQENFKDRYSRDLKEFEDNPRDEALSVGEIKAELSKTRENLRRLGQVNLMAPEEFSEVKERYEFLYNQLQDLRQAREDLEKVTKEIQTESVELFMKTYQQIKKHFHTIFRQLFGGGRAEIKLLDPDDVLGSGIEILAQPPGKKLESIALLSGGEKSLTAVALLFATYRVKPSPFCILDEIDAALDEQNVQRFVNMLLDFGERSQFIVITHNKKTVAGAKTLLGVTMQESGVSKLIAIRLDGQDGQEEKEEETV